MASVKVAPYGSWKSPITAELIVAGSVGLSQIQVDGDDVYWVELRPDEGGRCVVIRRTPDGTHHDLTPPTHNARTRVHEYGGGSFLAADGAVFYSNFADQRLYRVDLAGPAAPIPLTPEGYRYADADFDAARGRLIAVREDHTGGGEPVNTVVALDARRGGAGDVLVAGGDFYSSPRLSPDGRHLAYLTWNHPSMPWDAAELYLAAVNDDGALGPPEHIAGGITGSSICQPQWSPDGVLHFVSDRTDWWNLYRWQDGRVEQLTNLDAEFAAPQWVFGQRFYDFLAPGQIVCAYTQDARWRLARLDCHIRRLAPLETPYTALGYLRARQGRLVCLAGASGTPTAVVEIDLASGVSEVLRRTTDADIDPGYISTPEPVEFPTAGGLTAHGLYYPPVNKDYAAPDGEKPPLVVETHGGPTSATGTAMRLGIQFYTSRGIAVLDVNYGGSSGYGRKYRQRLNGQWGVVDVDDVCNGALYLAQRGLADENRLGITGGSAGGYTTLAALAFRKVFTAGCSHFGVSDCEALARETHKFESRYLDTLIAPYPAGRELYIERSPIHHLSGLTCPVAFFQGLEDKIVPPNQAQMMFDALKARGVPTAYVAFEGEQHGFRKAANIRRALEGELYFFSRIFGFALAEPVEPLEIVNLPPADITT